MRDGRSAGQSITRATWSSTISEICSRVSGWKRTMSSRRLTNSGLSTGATRSAAAHPRPSASSVSLSFSANPGVDL